MQPYPQLKVQHCGHSCLCGLGCSSLFQDSATQRFALIPGFCVAPQLQERLKIYLFIPFNPSIALFIKLAMNIHELCHLCPVPARNKHLGGMCTAHFGKHLHMRRQYPCKPGAVIWGPRMVQWSEDCEDCIWKYVKHSGMSEEILISRSTVLACEYVFSVLKGTYALFIARIVFLT